MNKEEFKKEVERIIYSIYPYSKLEFRDASSYNFDINFKCFFKGEVYGASMWVNNFMLEKYPKGYGRKLIEEFIDLIHNTITNIIIERGINK